MKTTMPGGHDVKPDSSRAVIASFGTPEEAAKYAQVRADSLTSRREARCIRRMLQSLSRGAHVLDLPCGTGRHLGLLADMGFRITAADASSHMLAKARQSIDSLPSPPAGIDFTVANLLDNRFADDAFDGVLCSRLLHHFPDPETWVAAMGELRRICSGPVIVSFFCSFAWDALTNFIRHAVSPGKPNRRFPVRYGTFRRYAEAAGLRVVRVSAVRPGVSQQWYAELQ